MKKVKYKVRCAECRRVRDGNNWVDDDDRQNLNDGMIVYSHGYCPECLDIAVLDIEVDGDEVRLRLAG